MIGSGKEKKDKTANLSPRKTQAILINQFTIC